MLSRSVACVCTCPVALSALFHSHASDALCRGLKFSPEEACQALDEMEMDGTRDGKVSLDEFVDWWNSDTATKKKGSIAGRLAEARDAAFKAELDAGSPMGKLLAAKAEAQKKADEAAGQAADKLGVDQDQLVAGAMAAGGVAAGAAGGKLGKVGKLSKASGLADKAKDAKAKAEKMKGMSDSVGGPGNAMKLGKLAKKKK